MISDESASRCTNHTTTKESAAYLIGKMDGEKSAIPVEKHQMLLREMYEQGKFDGALEAEEAYNTADVARRAEVAREIFEEIASKQITIVDHVGTMGVVVLLKDIFELQKKYTGG
jgi:hypothetical protein